MYALTLQNELFAWTPLSTLFPSGAEPVHTFTLILHHVLCFAATQTVYLVVPFCTDGPSDSFCRTERVFRAAADSGLVTF